MSIVVESAAFNPNDAIPHQYTSEFENYSPPLDWSDVPAGTQELALVCDDPDAPRPKPFVHWVIYGINPKLHGLPINVPPERVLNSGARQGLNDFGRLGYSGPLPPRGDGAHHYRFTLYALDTPTHIEPGVSKDSLMAGIDGHVLDRGELVGTYERS